MIDDIFVEFMIPCGRKTLEKFMTPTESGANMLGKNVGNATTLMAEIWLAPDTTIRRIYRGRSAFKEAFGFGTGSRAVLLPLLKEQMRNDTTGCNNDTHSGKNCQIAMRFCFVEKSSIEGAGKDMRIVGMVNPSVILIGMLSTSKASMA